MVSPPLLAVGAFSLIAGVYVHRNAEREFERAMELKGMDPDAVNSGGRRSAVERNRLVSKICIVGGLLVAAVGLVV